MMPQCFVWCLRNFVCVVEAVVNETSHKPAQKMAPQKGIIRGEVLSHAQPVLFSRHTYAQLPKWTMTSCG